MTTYVDTSALLKAVVDEGESEAFTEHVQDDLLMSSSVVVTELHRAATRLGVEHATIARLLDWIDLVEVTPAVLARAALLPHPSLRSLDAIHIASAMAGAADEFVTYDDRQADAARAAGLVVVTPSVTGVSGVRATGGGLSGH